MKKNYLVSKLKIRWNSSLSNLKCIFNLFIVGFGFFDTHMYIAIVIKKELNEIIDVNFSPVYLRGITMYQWSVDPNNNTQLWLYHTQIY